VFEPEEEGGELVIAPPIMAGVWADSARVAVGPNEFTLDFLRHDPLAPAPGRRVVGARVTFSPQLAPGLIELLTRSWAVYARRAMPPEVHGDDQPER
jgi:hypothetical protein